MNPFPRLTTLPYHEQSVTDNQAICDWNGVPQKNLTVQNIGPIVDALCAQLPIPQTEQKRRGNIMARVRMIMLYDWAQAHDALVCGTENKSEKYLGYFTRFGDEASDIEPIQHLYKSDVRSLAQELGLPKQFLTKAPSAGLWEGQTDEQELGFTYAEADQVIAESLHEKDVDPTVPEATRTAVLNHIKRVHFKHEVPYTLPE